jgi:hypothetical protein
MHEPDHVAADDRIDDLRRRELLDEVLKEQLPRYGEALRRLGECVQE